MYLAGRGDFNKVLKARDKFDGNNISINRENWFWNCFEKCNFIDLGFKGSKYTWRNKIYSNRLSLILERIARCLATTDCIGLYPNASVTHLPLLLSLYNTQTHHARPLRLETMWCGHPDLPLIIQLCFTSNATLPQATWNFQHQALKWNKRSLGTSFIGKSTSLLGWLASRSLLNSLLVGSSKISTTNSKRNTQIFSDVRRTSGNSKPKLTGFVMGMLILGSSTLPP